MINPSQFFIQRYEEILRRIKLNQYNLGMSDIIYSNLVLNARLAIDYGAKIDLEELQEFSYSEKVAAFLLEITKNKSNLVLITGKDNGLKRYNKKK